MNFKLEDGKLVGVAEEWNIGDEFTTPETGEQLFTVSKVLQNDVEARDKRSRAGYTIFTKSYITKTNVPTYSLSEEMKEWVKSNPKDSYELGKDFEVLSWEDDEPHKKKSFAVPIKPQNNKILSNENGI